MKPHGNAHFCLLKNRKMEEQVDLQLQEQRVDLQLQKLSDLDQEKFSRSADRRNSPDRGKVPY